MFPLDIENIAKSGITTRRFSNASNTTGVSAHEFQDLNSILIELLKLFSRFTRGTINAQALYSSYSLICDAHCAELERLEFSHKDMELKKQVVFPSLRLTDKVYSSK